MEKDAHYFWIGLFVTLSLTAFVAFFIWLAGLNDTRSLARYTVYFMDPISGLQEGANVQYKGLAVGKVIDTRLAHDRSDLIKVDIEIDPNTPVMADTRASLATLGVTGLVYIELQTEASDKAPPQKIDGERYPVIQGSGTQISKLFQDIPAITKQVLELSEKLNKLMDEGNVAKVDATLGNLERLTRDMNGLLTEQNVASASTTLQNMAAASEELPTMIDKLNGTADQMDQAMAALNRIVTRNEASINNFSRNGLDEITAMSRETKMMAASIRRMADKLDKNPSRLLYKPNYHGVEIQK